uniref:Uncharacterized protein n=1 Tax=Panagrolaimus sp. PS1159 TaxID=55785 RepID=A0AC35F3K8_9BILA
MPTIALNRCICVHSMSQIIDIAIQYLLFQCKFVPETIQQLISDDPNSKAVAEYHKICECLRNLFKAGNIRRLREIVIILGATPYLAEKAYRIPLKFCEEHANSLDKGCGQTCGDLSKNEIRKVFGALFQTLNNDELNTSSNRKFFIYARVSQTLYNASKIEEIEEDDGFELPHKITPKIIKVRYCREMNDENVELEENKNETTENGIWLRFTPFFSTH